MDTKDILTLVGILLVLIVGLINIGITLKNRRNVIREHLFKEQVSFHYKLFYEVSQLSREVDNYMNNSNRDQLELKRQTVQNLIFENEFILENETISLVNDLLDQARNYDMLSLMQGDKSKSQKIYDSYNLYYNSYFNLLKFARSTFGIDSLSAENKKLHSENRTEISTFGKVVIGTIELATQKLVP